MFKKSGSCCVIKCRIEDKRMKMLKMIVGLSVATAIISCAITKAKKRIDKNIKEKRYINGNLNKKEITY